MVTNLLKFRLLENFGDKGNKILLIIFSKYTIFISILDN